MDKWNLQALALEPTVAHGGEGMIRFCRVVEHDGPLHFVDVAVLPPGVSIGRHRHGLDEVEYYLVLDGTGSMTRDGETFAVGPGDLIRNRPGGEHGLVNTGSTDLRIFVFELDST